jgi:hypothetical protein
LIPLCLQAVGGTAERQVAERTLSHLLSHLALPGRHRISDLLRGCGRLDEDWTADYRIYSRERLPLASVWDTVRAAFYSHLADTDPIVAVLDDSRFEKTGTSIPGAGWVRDPLGPKFQTNLIWAQRIVQISGVAPGFGDHPRTIPLAFADAPKLAKRSKSAPPLSPEEARIWKETARQHRLTEVGLRAIISLRADLDRQGQAARLLVASFDNGYTNKTLMREELARTVLVGRLRKDAKLFAVPTGRTSKRGRPILYGERLPTPEQMRQAKDQPWECITLRLDGHDVRFRFRSSGPVRSELAGAKNLRVVVVQQEDYGSTRSGNKRRREPTYLVCTDADMPGEQIVRHAFSRWGIEVNFRDEKTLMGVGQAQVTSPASVVAAPSLAVAAYALLHLAALSAYPDPTQAPLLKPAAWQRRGKAGQPYTTIDLLRQFKHEIWGDFLQATNKTGFASSPPSGTKPVLIFPDAQSTLLHNFSG